MKVRYINQQDENDPMNGLVIAGNDELAELLGSRRKSAAFIADLSADNGYQLTIGIGGDISFAQYMRSDGELPYLVAVPSQQRASGRYVEFLINNTPTPIPVRYILSSNEMEKIAEHFLATGNPSNAFSWEAM